VTIWSYDTHNNFRMVTDENLTRGLIQLFVDDFIWPSYEAYVQMEGGPMDAVERRLSELGLVVDDWD
jgi:hypothetical protein